MRNNTSMSTLFTSQDQEQYRHVYCLYLPSELSNQHNKRSGFCRLAVCAFNFSTWESGRAEFEATYIIRPCLLKGGGSHEVVVYVFSLSTRK